MELTIDQALQQGIAAHKEGKVQEAERLYRAILGSYPKHPDANHNLGVLAVGVSKSDAALPHLKIALENNPKIEQFWLSYVNALIKLGQLDNARQVLNQRKGSGLKSDKLDQLEAQLNDTVSFNQPIGSNNNSNQLDDLISLYNRGNLQGALVQGNTLAQQFPNSHALLNVLGATYSELGKYEEAITSYNKVLEIKPEFAEAHYNLANTLRELGSHEAAIASYNKAIEIKPDLTDAYNNLGIALNFLGRYEEAITSYNKAIELKPDYVETYNNMGNALNGLGKHEEAIVSFNKAIGLKPNYAQAYNNLGIALNFLGRYEEAITSYNKAIELKLDYVEAYENFSNVLTHYKPEFFSSQIAGNYLTILNLETVVRPNQIASSIIVLLKHHDTLKEAINLINQNELQDLTSELCTNLSKIPLFLKIIELCPIPDLEIENLLIELRRKLLIKRQTLSKNDNLLSFQSSLALQCFTNEFVYGETEEETAAVKVLEAMLQKSFFSKETLSPYDIACLASYRSLHNYPWINDLAPSPGLAPLLKRQVIEVNQEQDLQKNIPRLNPITDDVSLAVRNQYEENPYPQWINTRIGAKPITIAQLVSKLELCLTNNANQFSESPQVLIAGCGTGQHSLNAASRFKNSYVTAIDLSLSSLSYAKRKTKEFGVTNIDYMQADILDLGILNKQFDIVESAGVLHHMADPVAGWKVLTDCLKPGGLMKIGLYSELAR
jgi:tetratricopeptide (TPR) repeat protein/2-polyprenyl-3-methyl-5-hydroxy-6-metoxy-1,4-benzoquinol methylase